MQVDISLNVLSVIASSFENAKGENIEFAYLLANDDKGVYRFKVLKSVADQHVGLVNTPCLATLEFSPKADSAVPPKIVALTVR